MDPEALLAAIEQQRERDSEQPQERTRPYSAFFLLGSYGSPLDQLREVARVALSGVCQGRLRSRGTGESARRDSVRARRARNIGLPPKTSAELPFLVALRGFGDPLGLIVDSIADIYAWGPTTSRRRPLPGRPSAPRASRYCTRAGGIEGLLDLARLQL